MGDTKTPSSSFQDPWFQFGSPTMNKKDLHWNEYGGATSSSSSTSFEASTISNQSTSSSVDDDDATTDDASSSSLSCLSSSNSNEGLYDLSDLMAELPIKRGLSKYYQGKSQSFTSLWKATSIEDLAKKAPPVCRRKPKATSKSFGGLSGYKSYTLLPKRVISKKGVNTSSAITSMRPPIVPDRKIVGR